MPSAQEGRPRTRSSFAAAVLSLIYPGLGHAYAGAWNWALLFATPPTLLIALVAGIALRVDRYELVGFMLQPWVLWAILLVNVVIADLSRGRDRRRLARDAVPQPRRRVRQGRSAGPAAAPRWPRSPPPDCWRSCS